jgi:uncharacterized protein YkvS
LPEKNEIEQNEKPAKKAEIGQMVEIKNGEERGKKGKVVVVRDNSVIVEIGMNQKTNQPIKTVINHKNYKLVK